MDSVPPWYSLVAPKPVYESPEAQAYWDVPVYAEQSYVKANRVDVRFVDHRRKRVWAVEMSCLWLDNCRKKEREKTEKYAPLRWELRKQYPGYVVEQCNVVIDVLGGWSKDLEKTIKKLVGARGKEVLRRMQKVRLT